MVYTLLLFWPPRKNDPRSRTSSISQLPITFSDLRFFFKSTPANFLSLSPSLSLSLFFSLARTHTFKWRNEKVRRNAGREVVGTLELNFNLQLVKKLAAPASARTDSRLCDDNVKRANFRSVGSRHEGEGEGDIVHSTVGEEWGGEKNRATNVRARNSRSANSLTRKSSLRGSGEGGEGAVGRGARWSCVESRLKRASSCREAFNYREGGRRVPFSLSFFVLLRRGNYPFPSKGKRE